MPVMTAHSQLREPSLVHDALLYRNSEEYVSDLVPFLTAGLTAGDAGFVAVPAANVDLLRRGLGDRADAVEFVDMTSVGRNPSRIIPTIRRFVDSQRGRRVRFIGEPIWPGRTATEAREATRHEAMLNTVFAHSNVHIRCPYDANGLDPAIIAESWCTHPLMITGGTTASSPEYGDPQQHYRGDAALTPPPPDAVKSDITPGGLGRLRAFVKRVAMAEGLPVSRIHDLVLATNEVATNTVVHSRSDGTLRIWRDGDVLTCEVSDPGHIADPFAGRHTPTDSAQSGRGLWMANQLCDLVELRSTPAGTVIRLHVSLDG
jgi:anti-sigma regulatory factor (Ser/Thr protein kinase)